MTTGRGFARPKSAKCPLKQDKLYAAKLKVPVIATRELTNTKTTANHRNNYFALRVYEISRLVRLQDSIDESRATQIFQVKA